MKFKENQKGYATGWGNNCAFHCFAHHLIYKMEKLDKEGTAKDLMELYNKPPYKALLEAFGQYFKIKNITPALFKALFLKRYITPLDREAIFGPFLRNYLSQLMTAKENIESPSNKENRKNQLGDFLVDVSNFLTDAKKNFLNPYPIEGNRAYLNNLKQEFLKSGVPVDQFLKNKKIEDYWLTEGYNNYGKYIGILEKEATVSNDDLSVLAEQFNIELRIYSAGFSELEPPKKGKESLTLFNGGRHWEIELDSLQEANDHNAQYFLLESIEELKKRLDNFSKQELVLNDELENALKKLNEAQEAERKAWGGIDDEQQIERLNAQHNVIQGINERYANELKGIAEQRKEINKEFEMIAKNLGGYFAEITIPNVNSAMLRERIIKEVQQTFHELSKVNTLEETKKSSEKPKEPVVKPPVVKPKEPKQIELGKKQGTKASPVEYIPSYREATGSLLNISQGPQDIKSMINNLEMLRGITEELTKMFTQLMGISRIENKKMNEKMEQLLSVPEKIDSQLNMLKIPDLSPEDLKGLQEAVPAEIKKIDDEIISLNNFLQEAMKAQEGIKVSGKKTNGPIDPTGQKSRPFPSKY